MKTLIKSIVWLFFLAVVGLIAAIVILSIEKTPAVGSNQQITFDQVKQVKELVDQARPNRLKKRHVNAFKISEKDLNLLISYGITQGLNTDSVFSKAILSDGQMTVWASFLIPSTPLGEYINISLDMISNGSLLKIVSLKIGGITLPGQLVEPLVSVIHQKLLSVEHYADLIKSVESIQKIVISKNQAVVVYEWDPVSIEKLKESSKQILLTDSHQKRLVFYHNHLMKVLVPYRNKKVSLTDVLKPMLSLASQQSKISNDPILENKALFQVLALYSNGKSPDLFVSSTLKKSIKKRVRAYITLKKRKDLAKHFLISSGLSVSTGSSFASFVGLAKEVEDSHGGTGFSFADLAADKAGVAMGEMAVKTISSAKTLQNRMAQMAVESDYMPAIDQLPEGIMALKFKKDYIELDSKSYNLVMDEIYLRLRRCRLYK